MSLLHGILKEEEKAQRIWGKSRDSLLHIILKQKVKSVDLHVHNYSIHFVTALTLCSIDVKYYYIIRHINLIKHY